MKMRFRYLMSVVAVLVFAAPAAAQSLDASVPAQVRQAPAAPRSLGFRIYGFYESVGLKSSQTFDGLFGTSRSGGFGLGGEVLDIWRGVFVRGAFSRATLSDGSQGFVINDQVLLTNVPLEVQINPLEFGAGWRQSLGPTSGVVVYGGASLLRVKYTETASFETSAEHFETTDSGFAFFGGIDALVWRQVFAGAEVQVRTIGDALGQPPVGQEPESVSFAFGETDLGGTVFRILGGVRW